MEKSSGKMSLRLPQEMDSIMIMMHAQILRSISSPRLSVMARSWKIIHDHGFFDTLLQLSWKIMDSPWQGMAPWIIIHDFDP